MKPSGGKWVWRIIAFVLVATLVAVIWNARTDGELLRYDKGETHVYNLAGERMIRGEEVFRTDDFKPFTYPPLMALWFVPIAYLPHYAVRPIWYAINFLMLGVVLWKLADLMRCVDAGQGRWKFWIPTVCLAARHVWSPLENQSNDLMILFFVMFGVHASIHRRDRIAGLMFALGAATKATPLLFLPVLAWTRRFGAVVAFSATLVAVLFVTEILYPRQDGHFWITTWYQTYVSGIDTVGGSADRVGNAWGLWNIRNQNLASMIYRFSTPIEPNSYHTFDVSLWSLGGSALKYTTFACQLAVVSVIFWALRPRPDDVSAGEFAFRRLGEVSMVVCGMVLLSPMSSKSHFCVLVLPTTYCCYQYFHRERHRGVLVCLVVMAFVTLTAKGIIGLDWGYQVLARGSVTWGTIAALTGTAIVLERSREASRPVSIRDQR